MGIADTQLDEMDIFYPFFPDSLDDVVCVSTV